MPHKTDWIAVAGLRAFDPEATATDYPNEIMFDDRLSLEAKGLYGLLLSHQGQPIDPYDDAIEDDEVIAKAIEELIAYGHAVRLARS
jgi:hypothetical protein